MPFFFFLKPKTPLLQKDEPDQIFFSADCNAEDEAPTNTQLHQNLMGSLSYLCTGAHTSWICVALCSPAHALPVQHFILTSQKGLQLLSRYGVSFAPKNLTPVTLLLTAMLLMMGFGIACILNELEKVLHSFLSQGVHVVFFWGWPGGGFGQYLFETCLNRVFRCVFVRSGLVQRDICENLQSRGAVSSVRVRDPPPLPALRAHLVTKGQWLRGQWPYIGSRRRCPKILSPLLGPPRMQGLGSISAHLRAPKKAGVR